MCLRVGKRLFALPRKDTRANEPGAELCCSRPDVSRGTPRLLFDGGFRPDIIGRSASFDVTADGQRFLMVQNAASTDGVAPVSIVVVQNWHEELKRLVPVD